VLDEVIKVMYFWLDMGVDGLRLDAIPYLCEREGTNNENLPETHEVVKKIRTALNDRYPDRMLLAEANQWPEDVRPYFGEGDECHMCFHFPLMPRFYMAIAQEDRHPITDILAQTPDIPETCQWAIFLRNHDEMTLEMVTDRERDYLWSFYAADRRMRINVGIRRRLAQLVDNDRQKIQLLNSLLMSMPGTPIIYYGDEIGMGDNIYLGDRDGVRTPMQWSPDRNGGFSKADPARLYLPAIMDPVFGYQGVNVEAQHRNPSSLLNWMRRLITAVRKNHRAFGRGSLRFLFAGNRKVLAYLREHEDQTILCVANLSRASQPVEVNLSEFAGRVPVELLGRSPFPPIGQLPYFITLPGHGFYWFLLTREHEAPSWHEPSRPSLPEFQTFVTPQGWPSLLSGGPKRLLESKVLPEFLCNQRWFAGKDAGLNRVELAKAWQMPSKGGGWLLTVWTAQLKNGVQQRYSLPLAIAWESAQEDPLASRAAYALGRVRQGAKVGGLHDAVADVQFVRTAISQMKKRETIRTDGGVQITFSHTAAFENVRWDGEQAEVRRLGREQSNTSLLVQDNIVFKVFRKVEAGINPEHEIGRFLTAVARYRNTPALLGAMEVHDQEGAPITLAMAQAFVANQGDGWTYTADYLNRYFEDVPLRRDGSAESPHTGYRQLMRTLGVRTAELHRAFATATDDPAFRPEPVTPADLAMWEQWIRRQADMAKDALSAARTKAREDLRADIDEILTHWKTVDKRIAQWLPKKPAAMKTRYHGDFHLGQVILAENDWYIIDFEGEQGRTLDDRRLKHSPLRDVSGMLRSLSYAAWSSVFAAADARPEGAPAALSVADEWESLAAKEFLAGYRDSIGDCSSFPQDEKSSDALIKLFMLEKSLYEICYEAANRPTWLRIPIRGARRILEGSDS
jgi:maltose alpha-D-glucosyltransferase/alpha-amylase